LQPLFDFAHWRNIGTVETAEVSGSGMSIFVGSEKSDAFRCGAALSRQLQNIFEIETRLLTNQTTPALIDCEYKCVEVNIGHQKPKSN